MFIHSELLILLLLTLGGQVRTGRIIGGHKAAAHSRPYMVLLKTEVDGTTNHCGGFLLNEDFVMTAAHCQARSYTVLLGVDNVNHNEEIQRINVDQTFPHKDYNATNLKNDIMLLKLSSKAKFCENVGPIALPSQHEASLPKSCSVSGWGRTDKNIYMSVVLMEVNVKLTENQLCAENNLYCSEGEIGMGKGDSGGPLVCEDEKAYGVVSFKFKPDSGGQQIDCYTKIADYSRWINLTMTKA